MAPRIYLDNAATSFPKPPGVYEAMLHYATSNGASPGRGQYRESRDGAALIRQCRQRLATLINNPSPDHIIFTLNTSDALNLAIKGIARAARLRAQPLHLVTTNLDHNSVLRPFAALASEGAQISYVPCAQDSGLLDLDAWNAALAARPTPTLAAINWVSNVTGTIQPLADALALARRHNVPTLVDAAQGLGHLPFDQSLLQADLVAFPGHKGLLGPQGTGALSIRPGFEASLATTREGGTGSIAELDDQPTSMPEQFEAGSHNTLGIVGLSHAVRWLLDTSIHSCRLHELALIRQTLHALHSQPPAGLRLLGPTDPELRVGTFTFIHDSLAPAEIAALLETNFNILARAGIHCAPKAHQTCGTLDHPAGRGGLRVSYGPFVTPNHVTQLLDALQEICADALTT